MNELQAFASSTCLHVCLIAAPSMQPFGSLHPGFIAASTADATSLLAFAPCWTCLPSVCPFFFCNNCIKHGWCFCCVVFFLPCVLECRACLMAAVLLVVFFPVLLLSTRLCFPQTLNVEWNSCLQSLIYFFSFPLQQGMEDAVFCSQPGFYDLQKREAGYCAPTSLLSLRLYLTASLACAQAGG